jgi:hypothetical protein
VAWERLERGDGEVAARQAALPSAGCRGAFPAGLGCVEVRGEGQGGPWGGKTGGAGTQLVASTGGVQPAIRERGERNSHWQFCK